MYKIHLQLLCKSTVKDTTDRCIDCKFYQKGEELFGLCKCKARYKKA